MWHPMKNTRTINTFKIFNVYYKSEIKNIHWKDRNEEADDIMQKI